MMKNQKLQAVRSYIVRVFIAISILFNVVTGGPSNQTFSARNYQWKRRRQKNLTLIIDRCLWFDKDHCKQSWTYWYIRKDVIHERELSSQAFMTPTELEIKQKYYYYLEGADIIE